MVQDQVRNEQHLRPDYDLLTFISLCDPALTLTEIFLIIKFKREKGSKYRYVYCLFRCFMALVVSVFLKAVLGSNLEKKSSPVCGFSAITHKNKEMFLCFELTNNPKKLDSLCKERHEYFLLIFLKYSQNIFKNA